MKIVCWMLLEALPFVTVGVVVKVAPLSAVVVLAVGAAAAAAAEADFLAIL